MDNFLSKIYHEERTKTAGAELDRYLEDLPADVLLKIAVAGTPHPELPTSLPDGEFKRMMDAVAEHVNKEHLSAIPTRKDSSSVSSISFQGEGKQPVENQDEALRHSKTAGVGSQAAKALLSSAGVGGVLGAGVGAIAGEDGDRVRSALKGALIGGGVGLGGNIGGAAGLLSTKGGRDLARVAAKYPEFLNHVVLQPSGERALRSALPAVMVGGLGGSVAGGIAGAKLAPKKKESGLTKECSVSAVEKAKIAMRAFSVARSAPANVKLAAASLAGKQLAKLAEETPAGRGRFTPEAAEKYLKD